MTKLADEFLPPPRVLHLLAKCPLLRQTPEVGAECPNWARSDLCGGRSAMGVPTANTKEQVPPSTTLVDALIRSILATRSEKDVRAGDATLLDELRVLVRSYPDDDAMRASCYWDCSR